MKFLVNKSYLVVLFLFFKMLLASECIDIWYQSNLAEIQSDLVVINTTIYPSLKKKNIDRLKIYIDKINSKIKIESSEQILLFDKQKSIKLFKKEKQLYIDNPDTTLSKLILSFFDDIYDMNNYNKISDLEKALKKE